MSLAAHAWLEGLVAPPHRVQARRLPRLARWKTDDPSLRDRYDTNTLVYGGVWMAQARRLRVFAPSPLNLWSVLKRADWRGDGHALPKPRLRRFKRYATLDFDAPAPVHHLTMTLDDWQGTCPIMQADPAPFAGCNVLYTMSQDNRLDWICDWVMYHHRVHGADAVIVSDNQSTAYTPQALLDRLSGLGVLRSVLVQSVPYRYGPSSQTCARASSARFLQSAVANYVRDAWLGQARAVLSCDIDELVVSNRNTSIFDAARLARAGVVTFPGYWRFCDPSLALPRHGDHFYWRADCAKPCPTKYAYRPDGPLGRWSLMTHSLEALPRKWASAAPEFWFAHCYGISTGWKAGRETSDADQSLRVASDMQTRLAKAGLGPSA